MQAKVDLDLIRDREAELKQLEVKEIYECRPVYIWTKLIAHNKNFSNTFMEVSVQYEIHGMRKKSETFLATIQESY